MLDVSEYSSASECFPDLRGNNKNKRRFSDDQIRSLEVIFESDTKLDPRRKLEVAKELGLQPRQVAVWFQNKRARWKSNQIQKDYSLLLDNYNNLASQFESLNKHKQALLIQLQKLKNQIAVNCQEKNEGQAQATAESDKEELLGQNHQDWGGLDSDDLIINQPTHDQSYQWWDFWN